MSEKRDRTSKFERQWREWANAESDLDGAQVKRNILDRIPDTRFSRRRRLVLVAAAASLLAVFIGVRSGRTPPEVRNLEGSIVCETGTNVVLVLREGSEPIYIATDRSDDRVGGQR